MPYQVVVDPRTGLRYFQDTTNPNINISANGGTSNMNNGGGIGPTPVAGPPMGGPPMGGPPPASGGMAGSVGSGGGGQVNTGGGNISQGSISGGNVNNSAPGGTGSLDSSGGNGNTYDNSTNTNTVNRGAAPGPTPPPGGPPMGPPPPGGPPPPPGGSPTPPPSFQQYMMQRMVPDGGGTGLSTPIGVIHSATNPFPRNQSPPAGNGYNIPPEYSGESGAYFGSQAQNASGPGSYYPVPGAMSGEVVPRSSSGAVYPNPNNVPPGYSGESDAYYAALAQRAGTPGAYNGNNPNYAP